MTYDIHQGITKLEASIGEDSHASLAELDELIATRNEAVYVAADHAAVSLIHALVEDVAPSLTCFEVESVADLYKALGRTADAVKIIDAHAFGDDEGDQHWRGPDDHVETAVAL